MNKFVNRSVEHPNRRKLKVNEIVYDDNGEISEIYVDCERSEGSVYVQGTELNAESMNKIVENIAKDVSKVISKEVIEKYVDYTVEEYIVDVPYEITDWETAEIIIPTSEDLNVERVKVYDDIFNYNFRFLSEWNYISLLVSTKVGVTDPGIYEYDHKFVLRSKTTDEIIKKIYLKLVLSTPSTTPED